MVCDGKLTCLGRFHDEEEAARKYDEHAVFMKKPVNFPCRIMTSNLHVSALLIMFVQTSEGRILIPVYHVSDTVEWLRDEFERKSAEHGFNGKLGHVFYNNTKLEDDTKLVLVIKSLGTVYSSSTRFSTAGSFDVLMESQTPLSPVQVKPATPTRSKSEVKRAAISNQFHFERSEIPQSLSSNANGSSSRYKGVYFDGSVNKFRACISINGVRTRLGSYIIENDAALAYDKVVSKDYSHLLVCVRRSDIYGCTRQTGRSPWQTSQFPEASVTTFSDQGTMDAKAGAVRASASSKKAHRICASRGRRRAHRDRTISLEGWSSSYRRQ
jgi:hypothetical protein